MKIPKQAKKVFSWKLFQTYQWQQKLYDGSYGTFEMIERPPCVDVIATVGSKVIVLKQSQPGRKAFYSLPSWRVEKWEMALSWAKRELLEETGFSSKSWQLFQSWNTASKIDFQESVFIARDCEMTELPNTDAWEKISMQLVSFDDFCTIVRREDFIIAMGCKVFIYECLLDKKLKQEFKNFIFWKKRVWKR